MSWKERADKAMKLSIEHWIEIRDADDDASSPSSDNCACCVEFHLHTLKDGDCGVCPIKLLTGEDSCYATPYYDARTEHGVRSGVYKRGALVEDGLEGGLEGAMAREVRFLSDVREKVRLGTIAPPKVLVLLQYTETHFYLILHGDSNLMPCTFEDKCTWVRFPVHKPWLPALCAALDDVGEQEALEWLGNELIEQL